MTMWLETVFLRILNMSVTAGVCIAVLLLIRLVFRKLPRKYLYALWLVAAFRLVCPVSVASSLSLFNLELFPMETGGTAGESAEYFSVYERNTEMEHLPGDTETEQAQLPAANLPDSDAAFSSREVSHQTFSGRALSVSSRIWAVGLTGFLLYFLTSWLRIRRRVRMAVRAEDGVYECDEIASPFLFGVLHPRIYIPCGMAAEQRELVVLHEKYHLRRQDHLIKLFSFALLGVYWFHPLVWIGWAAMCRDMEMSCDEHVLGQLGAERRTDYSRALLALGTEPGTAARLPLAFGENDVKRRVRHALMFRKPAVRAGIAAAVLLLAVLIFLGTDGTEPSGEQEYSAAVTLYENRNPYVGDVSANGRLIGAIGEALPESPVNTLWATTELQTSEEPYEFHFVLGETLDEEELAEVIPEMVNTSVLMLALTDNLGEVQWLHPQPDGSVAPDDEAVSESGSEEQGELLLAFSMSAAEAGAYCGVENVKAYSESAEQVQELLELLARLDPEAYVSLENASSGGAGYLAEGFYTEGGETALAGAEDPSSEEFFRSEGPGYSVPFASTNHFSPSWKR